MTATPGPPTVAGPVRRRSSGARLGPLPVVNLVVLELGFALGLVLLAVATALWPVAVVVLLIAAVLGLGRWRGRWLVLWVQLFARYLLRSHDRSVTRPDPATPVPTEAVLGPEDPRIALLRLMLPDLVVAHGTDHEREPLGLAWHQGTWTAVLQVDATPSLVTPIGGTPNLPLGALAPCLEDRGVVLDAIQVIWHCYPGSAALPLSSPALRSYLEVLGPLPAAARRTTWVAVRLDPRRCLAAVAERGGGVTGSHRALIGALSRIRSALDTRGVPTRPLDADQLLRAGIAAAELSAVVGPGHPVTLRERWTGVTAAGVGHASYAITNWPAHGAVHNLNALTGVRVLSTTVALSIVPGEDGAQVGVRGLVRISARSPEELTAADEKLQAVAARLGVGLTALRGLQVAGLAATLPLGASA
ncbi:MAG TPA: type VII secretion protein EccE [Pseudonocardiaceae bacterium]|jgi:type VII secretion protein EccE|nr:type VII secretion protein EccE [Pseudonocardiaceae bacterium]